MPSESVYEHVAPQASVTRPEKLAEVRRVMREKGAVYRALDKSGIAIVNADDAYVRRAARLARVRKVETFGQVVGVDELKDVKVKEIETVTALANEKKGTPGEERGDGVRAAESKNKGGEDGSHEAAVH